MSSDISAFFNPRSIAIVGATNDEAKWGHIIARQALRSTKRPVYLINTTSPEVLGQKTYKATTDIEGGVDAVVIAVRSEHLGSAVDNAVASGARAIIIITAGLGESGEDGAALQRELVAKANASGARIIGPNCLGVVDNHQELFLASNEFEIGSIALLSQSGNLALELREWFRSYEIGFSRFVSLGNQSDVNLVDLIDSAVEDGLTKAIAIYVEEFADGRGFIEAALRAAKAGKPIVALTAGSSDAAQRSAKSHTGALTSATAVIDAAFKTAGVISVKTPREMVIALKASIQPRRSAGNRIAIVTDGGGHATVAADIAEGNGFVVPQLSKEFQKKLQDSLWPPSTVNNPVDLAGYGEQDLNSYADTVISLLESDEIDAVVLSGYFGGYSSPAPFAFGLGDAEIQAAQKIADYLSTHSKPFGVQTVYPDSPSIARLTSIGVPAYSAIEDTMAAMAVAQARDVTALLSTPAASAVTDTSYSAMMNHVIAAGIDTVAKVEITSIDHITAFTSQHSGPFVLKANGLVHKSDAGGVVLNLADQIQVRSAFEKMAATLQAPTYSLEVMQDLSQGIEVIVGVTRDVKFGSVLLVGLGGTMAEITKDSQLLFAPVTPAQARTALQSLRGAALFKGFRGGPVIDLEKAGEAISAISYLAASHPEWSEFEINPLLLTSDGAVALDARAIL